MDKMLFTVAYSNIFGMIAMSVLSLIRGDHALESNSILTKMNQLSKRFIGTNLLWFLFNIPMIILSYYTLDMDHIKGNYMMLVPIVCLAPFVFFPATSAMFAVLRKFIMGEEVPIIQFYLKYYKQNYFNSLFGGILISLLWYLLANLYFLWADLNPFLNLLVFIMAVILFVFMTNFISTIVHMEVKLFAAYKNALIITIGAPLLTIVIGVASAAMIYISANVLPFLVLLITGSAIAYFSFFNYYNMMINIQNLSKPEEENKEVSEEES